MVAKTGGGVIMKAKRGERVDRLGLMIVEDDTFILDDLATILDWDAESYTLVTATNGKQGLHKFEEVHPLIVLTDVRMPAMDGLEMMAEIKKQNPYVQILILSAYDDFAQVQEALRQGAKEYLLKQDITAELLREKLSGMRRNLEEQREFALNAVKNRIYELITAPAEDPAKLQEQLHGILRLGGYFPDELLLAPARRFAVQLMRERGMADLGPEEEQKDAFFDALRSYLIGLGKGPRYLRGSGIEAPEPETVSRAKAYMEAHFQDPNLSVQDVARVVGISYGRLGVLFREKAGCTINDYLTELRIREAKRLLCTGDYKVYEVAERVGYRSSQYFSYAFHQKTGQSPNHYRKGE